MKTIKRIEKMGLLIVALLAFSIQVNAQKKGWAGSYVASHCAGKTAGGTSICYNISFEIDHNDTYYGSMSIDGWQCMVRANVYAEVEGNKLTIYYDSPQDDNMGFNVAKGTKIVTITKGKKRLIAHWGQDMIEYEFVVAATRIQ